MDRAESKSQLNPDPIISGEVHVDVSDFPFQLRGMDKIPTR